MPLNGDGAVYKEVTMEEKLLNDLAIIMETTLKLKYQILTDRMNGLENRDYHRLATADDQLKVVNQIMETVGGIYYSDVEPNL